MHPLARIKRALEAFSLLLALTPWGGGFSSCFTRHFPNAANLIGRTCRKATTSDEQVVDIDHLALAIFTDVLATDTTDPADCIICKLRRQMKQTLNDGVHDDAQQRSRQ